MKTQLRTGIVNGEQIKITVTGKDEKIIRAAFDKMLGNGIWLQAHFYLEDK